MGNKRFFIYDTRSKKCTLRPSNKRNYVLRVLYLWGKRVLHEQQTFLGILYDT